MPPHAARWLREQVLFLLVLAVFAGGFGYLIYGHGHWVRSTFVMGCAMVLAGGLRAAVPASRVGLLAVRARWIDALVYLALGGVVLAVDIRLHQ
jgi:DUF3017 family protein